LISLQISVAVQAFPLPVLLRAKESKASITNEDEERVTCEGQSESPKLQERGVKVFLFLVVLGLCSVVQGGVGFGVEKNPKPMPRPSTHGLAKIQTVLASINLKIGRGGEVHAGWCGFARFLLSPT